ncbi:tyrosine-type recombinase/integrase [Yunchengibacter salinarum]|uniref:tyrosine-type recombinase/integrase n=1 Tax=Yunchengibacter salinarum TaxID=3133399 RepID=UPI0035B66458
MKLLKKTIDATGPGQRDKILWDGSLQGFGLRVKPSGVKSFIIQYRNAENRSRRKTLGRYGRLTLDEARAIARKELAEVAAGRDPRQDIADARLAITVAELAARFLEQHCELRCKPSTIKAYRDLIEKSINPSLGGRSIEALQPKDVDRFHQSLKGTPYTANRSVAVLRSMFNRAENWGLVPRGHNPAANIRAFRERRRQRFLNIEELEQLTRAIKIHEQSGDLSIYAAAAFRLLLSTGARLNEIRTLKWENVDFDAALIILTEHKTSAHGAKAIPLNTVALRILDTLPRMHQNPYVICGERPGQPIINLQKPWRRVRRTAGLEDLRIHDLRHTFASLCLGNGASLPVVGGLLGHRSTASTAIYAHLAPGPLQQATAQVSETLDNLI